MSLHTRPPLIPKLSGDVAFLGTVPQHQVQSQVLCLRLGCENTPHSPPPGPLKPVAAGGAGDVCRDHTAS